MKTTLKVTSALIVILAITGCATSDSERLDKAEERIKVIENCFIRKKLGLRDDGQVSIAVASKDAQDGYAYPETPPNKSAKTEDKILALQRQVNAVESRLKALETDERAKLNDLEKRLTAIENYIIHASTNNPPASTDNRYPIIADRLDKIELRLKTLESVDLLKTLDIPAPALPDANSTETEWRNLILPPRYDTGSTTESKPALP